MEWAAHYGAIAFLPLMLINGIGMPLIPAETLLLGGAILAAKGEISFSAMLICAYIGTAAGSAIGWSLGRWGGAALIARFIRLFRIDPDKLAKLEQTAQKHGVYFIIIARFIPVAREMNGLLSGSLKIDFRRFMTGNCIGAFLWIAAWCFLPYLLGHAL